MRPATQRTRKHPLQASRSLLPVFIAALLLLAPLCSSMALTPFFGARDPFYGGAARDPFWALTSALPPFDEFSSLLEQPLQSFMRESRAVANTAVDVKETPKELVFTADMPGLRKEEVKVQVEDGNVLCISGERSREKVEDTDRYHRMERSMGRFQRRFRLPDRTDPDQIKASVDHGVLTVTVPKVEEKEPEKQAIKDVPIA